MTRRSISSCLLTKGQNHDMRFAYQVVPLNSDKLVNQANLLQIHSLGAPPFALNRSSHVPVPEHKPVQGAPKHAVPELERGAPMRKRRTGVPSGLVITFGRSKGTSFIKLIVPFLPTVEIQNSDCEFSIGTTAMSTLVQHAQLVEVKRCDTAEEPR